MSCEKPTNAPRCASVKETLGRALKSAPPMVNCFVCPHFVAVTSIYEDCRPRAALVVDCSQVRVGLVEFDHIVHRLASVSTNSVAVVSGEFQKVVQIAVPDLAPHVWFPKLFDVMPKPS